MARNEFEREVGELLRAIYPIAERLDDAAFNRAGQRQVRQKPWDYYGATIDGKFWAAEVKRVKSPRFPLENLKPHQRAGLIVAASVGLALVFINWRTDRKAGIAIMVPFDTYYQVEQAAMANNRKSLKPKDFDSSWQLERVTGGWKVPDSLFAWVTACG
ncbi:MAG: hypothetical protein A2W25_11770 [candidate division Zixibacteria bacterium RBG_16_53_22]|nr:MAG: hypothetical protein A2W25_11770 [candidate division Zixibacteria bacterium RBG_16_53_22]